MEIITILNFPFEGGHLKPDPYSRAASILKTHGPAVAEHVASFEARQVEEVKAFLEREGIECDFEETRVKTNHLDRCQVENHETNYKLR